MIVELILQLLVWANGVILGLCLMHFRISKRNDSYWRSIYRKEAEWNQVLYTKLISAYKKMKQNINDEHWKDPEP